MNRYTETPMQVVRKRWMCVDIMCDGEMIATGLANEHKCSKCGHMKFSPDSRTYPYMEFVDLAPADGSYDFAASARPSPPATGISFQ